MIIFAILQLVAAFEKVSGKKTPYQITDIRPGDVPLSFASVEKANTILGWKAEYTYEDCARDSWNWQDKNPHGYSKE